MRIAFGMLMAAGATMGVTYGALGGGSAESLAALALGVVLAAAGGWYQYQTGAGQRIDWRIQLALAALVVLCLPVYYGATGGIIEAVGRERVDESLIAVDRALFGWAFPQGQVSLGLDRSSWLGPQTVFGKFTTEVFQLFYFSYYFWGFGLLGLLLFRVGKSRGAESEWLRLQMFLCAWIGAYILNFTGYILVPAIGPKYFYPELFEHEVSGFGFAGMIQDFIVSQQATSEDCFPSGHTALSWITAVAALKFAPRYGRWALAAAVPITLATLFLRYHYVIDLIAAVPLVLAGLFWGGFLRPVFQVRAVLGEDKRPQPSGETESGG